MAYTSKRTGQEIDALLDVVEQGGGSGGGGSVIIDTAMSDTSTHAVQNKVIKKYVDEKFGSVSGGIHFRGVETELPWEQPIYIKNEVHDDMSPEELKAALNGYEVGDIIIVASTEGDDLDDPLPDSAETPAVEYILVEEHTSDYSESDTGYRYRWEDLGDCSASDQKIAVLEKAIDEVDVTKNQYSLEQKKTIANNIGALNAPNTLVVRGENKFIDMDGIFDDQGMALAFSTSSDEVKDNADEVLMTEREADSRYAKKGEGGGGGGVAAVDINVSIDDVNIDYATIQYVDVAIAQAITTTLNTEV